MARPPLTEILGLLPLRERLAQTWIALAGDAFTPKTRAGLSSLTILRPWWAAQLWAGRNPYRRRAAMYNLFNHTPTPIADGWSVRKTQVRDFRGGTSTYDSHNGTDFAIPPATTIVAPAPATVRLVVNEFHRGGLKMVLDHGDGLITSLAHLTRALARVGDVVARGQPVALSGASGLNFVSAMLMDPPHLHFNVWLNGVPVDPFAAAGEGPLWHGGNDPVPWTGSMTAADATPPPSRFSAGALDQLVAACRDPAMTRQLRGAPTLEERGCLAVYCANYYPTRFTRTAAPYEHAVARTPRLDLPLLATEYEGVAFPS